MPSAHEANLSIDMFDRLVEAEFRGHVHDLTWLSIYVCVKRITSKCCTLSRQQIILINLALKIAELKNVSVFRIARFRFENNDEKVLDPLYVYSIL